MTIPIGAWITSIVFDIGSHVVDDPGFLTQGSHWLIAIGVLGALLAAVARGQIALSVVSLVARGASGYLGGKLAYRYGVRVAADPDQAEGFVRQR